MNSMKKIIPTTAINIFCFITLLLLPTHCAIEAKIDDSKDKYVAAKSGINLRSGPGKSSSVITLIPFESKVTIEKSDGDEIFLDGRYGKWVNVKFGNKTGWVFSGFLCDFKPNTIIKIAADFYRNKYKGYSNKRVSNFKDSEVTLENILDNYIVLSAPALGLDIDDVIRLDFLWRYDANQKKFFEENFRGQVYLLYLDKDKYPDLVVKSGCCAMVDLDVYLGSETGFIKIYKLPDEFYLQEVFYLAVGHCEEMEFVCAKEPFAEIWYIFRFNCDTRKVKKYTESKNIRANGTITSIDLKNLSLVIKDKESSKTVSYKLHKNYASAGWLEYLKGKNYQQGDDIVFNYIILDGKKIILKFFKEEKKWW